MHSQLQSVVRAGLLLWAFASTAFYALAAGTHHNADAREIRITISIAIAAAASWLILGSALRRLAPDRRALMSWFDRCLIVIAVGDLWLVAVGILAQLMTFAPPERVPPPSGATLTLIHLGALAPAAIIMTALFLFGARQMGATRARALALWLCPLNTSFLLILLILGLTLGFLP